MSRYLLIVVALYFSGLATARENGADANPPTVKSPTVKERLVEGDKAVSKVFDQVAHGIDVFLSQRESPGLINRTRVSVENSTVSTEGKLLVNSTHLNVALHLPNLEEYWQLKFTTYDDIEEERLAENTYLRRTPRVTSYGTSVGFFQKIGRIKTAFQPRIELSNPLKISHSLRFLTDFEFTKVTIHPRLEFFAQPGKGTGVSAGLNFGIPLSKIYTLSLINGGEYEERGNQFSAGNGFSIGQYVWERGSIAYALIFNSNNRPSYHLDSYTVSAAWTHLLFKNVLHYQVVPLVDFAKAKAYKGAAGLIFNVSLIF